MTKLPRDLSGQKVVKALLKMGFTVRRQKGSHIVLRREDPFALVVVPDHKRLDTGTLDSILEGASISNEDFMKLLK